MALRLLTLFLLLTTILRAQEAPAPPPPLDSAYAVHNLFRQRRNNGLGAAGYGFASLTGTVFAARREQGILAGFLTVATAVSTVVAVRQLGRYSESREEGIVRRYEQGWPLPTKIRRRLKPKYFKPLD